MKRGIGQQRGGLGPDLERECTVEAQRRLQARLNYSTQAKEAIKNAPTRTEKIPEKSQAEKLAERRRDYAKSIPKPQVRMTQSSMEVSTKPVTLPKLKPESDLVRLMDLLREHDRLREECTKFYEHLADT
ncbi:hypothetical protein GMRT_13350 [Giardia muris]|uniref:Uncharacterized protein n=1 Tax=Giardia muris TaxID=5742 RepID=A0A4Z1SN92_GIAMU|nr:hypothetical protein GMRT_13350 [Giardia muris]|eukprot:TNJ26315.1 hypothetical protein GMRT_13350 [Giardia muris]